MPIVARKLPLLARIMTRTYADPRPTETLEQFLRSQHADLQELDDDELDRELVLCRLRYFATPRDQRSQWLRERLPLLEREAARRQQQRAGAARR